MKNRPRRVKKAVAPSPDHFDPDAASAPGAGVFGLPFGVEDSRIVLLPVPFEATTSYGGGASLAPRAILDASRQVDLFDRETGRPYEAGIAMASTSRRVTQWNREAKRLAAGIIRVGGRIERSARLTHALDRVNQIGGFVNAWVHRETTSLLDRGKTVIVVGGDHSAPFGAMQAYAERYPGLGILHIDAHCDLRDAFEGFTWSHASIFHNVITRIPGLARLVQVGVRDMGEQEDAFIRASRNRIILHHDAELADRSARGDSWSAIVERIVADLPSRVYISFDIDGLDPTLCPHTGTPVPGGLSFHQATSLMLAIPRSGRTLVGGDLCEVSPGPKAADGEWDANVGARILYKMIGSIVLSTPTPAAG